MHRIFVFILTFLLLFVFLLCPLLVTALNITSKYEFSPSMYKNPNAAPSPNDTVTTIEFVFTEKDGVMGADGLLRFEFETRLPTSNGEMVVCPVHVTTSRRKIYRQKTLKGVLPQKTLTVDAVVRQGRNSAWFVKTGNVGSDNNIESLEEVLFQSSAQNPGVRRRLLNALDDIGVNRQKTEKNLNNLDHLDKHREQHFIDRTHLMNRKKSLKLHEKHEAMTKGFAEVHKMLHSHQTLQEVVANRQFGSTFRKLLQQVQSYLDPNPVILAPSKMADLDTFQDSVGQFLTTQDLAKEGSIAMQGAQTFNLITGILNKATKDMSNDITLLNRANNLTSVEYVALQTEFNKTSFAQIDALYAQRDTDALLQQRNEYILQSATEQLNTLAVMADVYRQENDVAYGALFSVVNTANISIENYRTTQQSTAIYQKSLLAFQGLVNSKQIAFYTQESIRHGVAFKYHEVVNLLEAAGFQVIKSTDFPAYIPLGHIPLQDTNIGHFFKFTIQATTNQPEANSAFFNDPDMRLVPTYRDSGSPYRNALQSNDQNQVTAQTSGSWFRHFRQITMFCTNEYINANKNKWYGLQDLIGLIGPTGCTPNVDCKCWAVVKRQRCGTSAPIGVNTPAPYRENIWESNGCIASSVGAAQIESNAWFPDQVNELSASITKQLGQELVTSALSLSNDLFAVCTMSTCNTPQTIEDSPPDKNTHSYAPYTYYLDFGQTGVSLTNSQFDSQVLFNNITYCGMDPEVMSLQTLERNEKTVPFAFFEGARIALEALLSKVGPIYDALQYGTRDRHISERNIPFHTPPSGKCPTCQGMSASGESLQQLHLQKIGATSREGFPVYHFQEIGREQEVSISIQLPDGSTIDYVYSGDDVVDKSPKSYKFLPKSFFMTGFLNCIKGNNCPSPDPGYIPSGKSYVVDTHRYAMKVSNTTQLRENKLDYFIDLSLSTNPLRYTLFNPENSAASFTPLNPPPVFSADAFMAIYGESKVDPSKMTDSPHRYVRLTSVDSVTGQVTCAPNVRGNANSGTFPDGEPCDWFSKEIINGQNVLNPELMDEFPINIGDQIRFTSAVTIKIPGSLVTISGRPQTVLCPSQKQLYIKAVENSWVSFVVDNVSDKPLNVSLQFSSTESPLVDSSIIVNNCNATFDGVLINAGESVSFGIGKCDTQHIKVTAYGQVSGSLSHPVYSRQTCLDFITSMTKVYSSQLLAQEQLTTSITNNSTTSTAAVSLEQIAFAAVQQSPTSVTQVLSVDDEFKLALYEQIFTITYGQQLQINLTREFNDYIYTLDQPVTTTVNGQPVQSVTVTAAQLANITSFQQRLTELNQRINTGILSSAATLYNQTQLYAILDAQTIALLDKSYQAAVNASVLLDVNIASLARLDEIKANISTKAAANLISLQQKNADFNEKLALALISANQTLSLPQWDNSGPPPVQINWPSATGSFGDALDGLGDLFVTIGGGLEAVLEFAQNVVSTVLNPSCPLGLCFINTILQYLMYAVYVVVAVIILWILKSICSVASEAKSVLG